MESAVGLGIRGVRSNELVPLRSNLSYAPTYTRPYRISELVKRVTLKHIRMRVYALSHT